MNGILVIAHAPLASALRQCVLHVFPEAQRVVDALDVPPDQPPEVTLAQARALIALHGADDTLVLTDLVGATPGNVAAQLGDGVHTRVVAGVNLPMLLRAVTYRHEPIDALVARATSGGTQGVMPLAPPTSPPTSP
ncbi:PTS system ascorbate-specific IIA component [Tepidimonas ignava]|uniref:PTS system ascorbate-specific IIA component n=1 Tax=Tepidimonas ignava TaxID=114249 RepID=A0A4R3LIF6_9BURK|nr:PTS fructose transporter subunit IIA [Tepidimonas ignava]TCS98254.1 PTS system ascorbate-specific IIA component [Tepidimonas ignava]TSE21763.1 PTS system mannose-specific EIIAB component [Tepidimonas ignava]